METVQALRGVCIAPERHLATGEQAEVDPATARFLVGIGAVQIVPPAPETNPEPAAPATKPAKQTTKET